MIIHGVPEPLFATEVSFRRQLKRGPAGTEFVPARLLPGGTAVFGIRLRLLFAMKCGLQRRGEKHDLVFDLLTAGRFPLLKHSIEGGRRKTAAEKCQPWNVFNASRQQSLRQAHVWRV